MSRAAVAARLVAAGLAAVLLLSFLRAESAALLEILAVIILLLSAVRPESGILVVAAFAPLALRAGQALHGDFTFTEPLVLACLTGWLSSEAFRRRGMRLEPDVAVPAGLLAALIVASVAVQLIVLQAATSFPGAFFAEALRSLPDGGYFSNRRVLAPLADGLEWLEGLALFLAVVVLARRDASLPRRLGLALAAGAASMALVNLGSLLHSAGSAPKLVSMLRGSFTSIRVSEAFPDYNAAGSYFALTLLLPAAIGRRAGIVPRWFQWTASGLVFVALWLTGSRTALATVPVAVAGTLWLQARHGARRRASQHAVTAAVVLVAMSILFMLVYRPPDPNRTIAASLHGRLELATSGLRMFAAHPVFGVGLRRFYEASPAYISPEFSRVIWRENAHNNFVQILAELGAAGFVAFLALLLAALRRGAGRVRVEPRSPALASALAGLIAFLLTCLAGHPLLTLEVALTFWIALGLVIALATPPDAERPTEPRARHRAWVACAAVAVLAFTVPFRASSELAQAHLGGANFGFSPSRVGADGRRFTVTQGRGRLYIPARTALLRLPLRVDGPPAQVRILVDGRPQKELLLEAGPWQVLMLPIPRVTGKRFVAVDLRSTAPDGSGAWRELQVGAPIAVPW